MHRPLGKNDILQILRPATNSGDCRLVRQILHAGHLSPLTGIEDNSDMRHTIFELVTSDGSVDMLKTMLTRGVTLDPSYAMCWKALARLWALEGVVRLCCISSGIGSILIAPIQLGRRASHYF